MFVKGKNESGSCVGGTPYKLSSQYALTTYGIFFFLLVENVFPFSLTDEYLIIIEFGITLFASVFVLILQYSCLRVSMLPISSAFLVYFDGNAKAFSANVSLIDPTFLSGISNFPSYSLNTCGHGIETAALSLKKVCINCGSIA